MIASESFIIGPHGFESQAAAAPLQVSTGRPALLIVEDEPVSRRALAVLLRLSGHPAHAVGSGEEAIGFSERCGVPRTVLVDIDLPRMNGLELIRRLMQLDGTVRPIILSARSTESLPPQWRARDIPYLRKPIDVGRLLALLDDDPHSSHR